MLDTKSKSRFRCLKVNIPYTLAKTYSTSVKIHDRYICVCVPSILPYYKSQARQQMFSPNLPSSHCGLSELTKVTFILDLLQPQHTTIPRHSYEVCSKASGNSLFSYGLLTHGACALLARVTLFAYAYAKAQGHWSLPNPNFCGVNMSKKYG